VFFLFTAQIENFIVKIARHELEISSVWHDFDSGAEMVPDFFLARNPFQALNKIRAICRFQIARRRMREARRVFQTSS
jgi:hypothetical protein